MKNGQVQTKRAACSLVHVLTHCATPWPSTALCSMRAEKERNRGGLTRAAQSFGSVVWLGDQRGSVMAGVGLDEVVAG
jgi:hypothetical protein